MSYKKFIFRETLILFISSVLTALSGYLLRVFLAKSLTVYDYGLFFGVFSIISTIIPFKDFGLASTVVRYLPEYNVKNEKGKINNAIKFLFFFQIVLYALIILVCLIFAKQLLASLISDKRSFTLFTILLLSYSFSIFDSMFNATYLGFKKIYLFSIFQFTASLILMLSCYATTFFGVTVTNIALAYFTAFFLTTVSEIWFFLDLVPGIFKHRFSIDKEQIKELFSFSLFQFLSSSFKNLSHSLSSIIMIWVSNLENVAYLNIAMPTANIIKFLFKPISIVLLPISSEINARDDKKSKNLIPTIYKYLIIAFVPVGLFFIHFSGYLIEFLFTSKYALASRSLSLFVFSYFFISVYELNSSILLGHKKKNEALVASIGFMTVNFVASLILIKLYGLIGAAAAYLISSVFSTLMTSYQLFMQELLQDGLINVVKAIGLGLVILSLSAITKIYLNNIFAFFLGLVLFTCFVFILNLITIDEIQGLVNKFR